MRLLLLLNLATCACAQGTGSVSGVVIDQAGAAIPRVSITLEGGEIEQEVETSTTGGFSFGELKPGEYQLWFRLTGFQLKMVDHLVVKPDAPTALSAIELKVDPLDGVSRGERRLPGSPSYGNLTGSVLRGDLSRHVAGAAIVLRQGERIIRAVSADGKGRFRFDRLEPGVYSLEIMQQHYFRWAGEVEVIRGVELDFQDILLEPCHEPTCTEHGIQL